MSLRDDVLAELADVARLRDEAQALLTDVRDLVEQAVEHARNAPPPQMPDGIAPAWDIDPRLPVMIEVGQESIEEVEAEIARLDSVRDVLLVLLERV